MFIDRPDVAALFDEYHFVREGERHYFRLRHVEAMLPITEQEAAEAMRAYRVRARIAMAAMWLIWLGALVWLLKLLVEIEADGRLLLGIPLAALAAAFLLHLWPPLAATRTLRRRLMALAREDGTADAEWLGP